MTERWRELLMKDHETTERVFAAAEKAFAARGGPSPGLVANLRAYLVDYVDRCHNQKEERAVFPALAAAGVPVEGGPVAVMLAEHRRANEHGEKIFPRTRGAIGTNVRNCHPAEERPPRRADPRRLQGRAARRGGVLDRHGAAQGPRPLLAGAGRGGPLPGLPRDDPGRHGDPEAARAAEALSEAA